VNLNPAQQTIIPLFVDWWPGPRMRILIFFFNMCWKPSTTIADTISRFQAQAPIWPKNVFENLGTKKKRIRARLLGI